MLACLFDKLCLLEIRDPARVLAVGMERAPCAESVPALSIVFGRPTFLSTIIVADSIGPVLSSEYGLIVRSSMAGMILWCNSSKVSSGRNCSVALELGPPPVVSRPACKLGGSLLCTAGGSLPIAILLLEDAVVGPSFSLVLHLVSG